MIEPTTATGTVFPEARMGAADRDRLRGKHYNATITSIRAHNPDLWVMRVRPDATAEPFIPGRYTTLGLGYWEPRVDDVSEDFDEYPELLEKVVRRSYSVSSSLIDDRGRLVPTLADEIEFYIVLLAPSPERIPGLTPRIFGKSVGDRIYLSRVHLTPSMASIRPTTSCSSPPAPARHLTTRCPASCYETNTEAGSSRWCVSATETT